MALQISFYILTNLSKSVYYISSENSRKLDNSLVYIENFYNKKVVLYKILSEKPRTRSFKLNIGKYFLRTFLLIYKTDRTLVMIILSCSVDFHILLNFDFLNSSFLF